MILTRKGINENENTTGYILLSTEPKEAEVWIDGQFKGQSIIQAELKEGSYSYEIKKEMYHSKKGDFEITRNETTELNEILQPNFGSLSINSTPEQNAEIVLDNVQLQQKLLSTIEMKMVIAQPPPHQQQQERNRTATARAKISTFVKLPLICKILSFGIF